MDLKINFKKIKKYYFNIKNTLKINYNHKQTFMTTKTKKKKREKVMDEIVTGQCRGQDLLRPLDYLFPCNIFNLSCYSTTIF